MRLSIIALITAGALAGCDDPSAWTIPETTNPGGRTTAELIRSRYTLENYESTNSGVTINYRDGGQWFETSCNFKSETSFQALMQARSAQDVYNFYEVNGSPRKLGDDDTTDFVIKLHSGQRPESGTYEVAAPYCFLFRLENPGKPFYP